jgi:hypothetical protein
MRACDFFAFQQECRELLDLQIAQTARQFQLGFNFKQGPARLSEKNRKAFV